MSTVMTCGCFDLLHVGHVRTLAYARSLSDRLVVLLDDDAMVRAAKGPTRPIHAAAARREVLSAICGVYDVIVCTSFRDQVAAIRTYRPAWFVKGEDWRGERLPFQDVLDELHVNVAYAPLVPGYSTTTAVGAI